MTTLNLESLRQFLKASSYIQKDTLLPVLGNIMLRQAEGGYEAIKTNLKSTIIYPVKASGDLTSLLLDIDIITNLAAVATGDFEIELQGDTYTLRYPVGAGRYSTTTLPLQDSANFPQTQKSIGQETARLIAPNALLSVQTARAFTVQQESAANYQYVVLNGSTISAFNFNSFYVNQGFTDLPLILLSAEAVDVLVNMDGVTHYDAGNYDCFYDNAGASYIFIKSENKPHNLTAVLKGLADEGGQKFETLKADWVTFCNIANTVAESEIAQCVLKDGRFTMDDVSWNRRQDYAAEITGEAGEFRFNSRLVAGPMKAIPYDRWQAKTNQHFLIIRQEDEYFTFIGMAANQ